MRNSLNATNGVSYVNSNGFPTKNNFCTVLKNQIYFPQCWDGKNLDVSGHRNHTAYLDINGNLSYISDDVIIYK
jgi:hypothetical protein